MRRRHSTRAANTLTASSALGLVFSLAACTTIEAPPAPLDPVMSARQLVQHSLTAPEVAAALTKMGLSPNAAWTLDSLTIAAWSLRSDIAVAAADINTALSAERVAGLLPNPTLNFDQSSFLTNNLGDPTVWVVATALNFTIETAGKREIRVDQARADTETRRWRLAELFWQARAEIRRALVARAIATESVALAEDELTLRQRYLDFVETQIRLGAGVGPDRLTAQTNLLRAQAQLRTARGDLATADAQIGAATGVAAENLPLAQLAPVAIDTLPSPTEYDLGGLREMALVNRLTVRHALADYAVTEQALRLAVARQYPDVNLGPGYNFDRGDHAITLAISAVVPLLHDERDAIAQAVNTRGTAAAQFQAAQSLALGEIDTATARYRAAYAALLDARESEDFTGRAVNDVQRRLAAGGADRGEVLTAQIGLALAQRARLDILRAAADALGALEDGVQRPVWPTSTLMVPRPDSQAPE
jgi:cobalt-zinc-cadmium efflux system outer membrane protein